MNDLKDAERALYDDKIARPDFYNDNWNFDPLQYLRKSTDEEGRVELSLDIKYRKHWFRLVYPQGQMRIHEKTITKEAAMFTVRVYADKGDDPESFLAEGTAIRYYGTSKAYERYYVDWAETMATGRALTSAGFDVPWCNKPTENGAINLYTGETITYEDDLSAPQGGPKRQYPDVTAPPPVSPASTVPDGTSPQAAPQAAQQPAQAQPAVSAPQTPAHQQAASRAAQAPAAPAPASPAAQTPAQRQAASQPQAPVQQPAAPVAQPPAQQAAPELPGQQPLAAHAQSAAPAPEPKTYEEALQVMTVERAVAAVITFGKNKGLTLGEVANTSPADIDWIANKYQGKDFMLKAAAKVLADAAIQKAAS